MKQLLLLSLSLFIVAGVQAQNQRPASPPAKVSETIKSGATISIDYSQPSLKGRIIGENVEPMRDSIWRMGANKATVFSTDKDVTIEGQKLPAGKYSMFGIWRNDGFTIIFNSAWDIWGTRYKQNKDKDVLKVVVKPVTTKDSQEQLTFTIDKSGLVTMRWGTLSVGFHVE